MSSSIYLPVWIDVLVQLHKAPDNRRYSQRISREVDTSKNHFRAIVKRLTEEKLIDILPTRKIHRIIVTEKGKRVAAAILSIQSELGWH